MHAMHSVFLHSVHCQTRSSQHSLTYFLQCAEASAVHSKRSPMSIADARWPRQNLSLSPQWHPVSSFAQPLQNGAPPSQLAQAAHVASSSAGCEHMMQRSASLSVDALLPLLSSSSSPSSSSVCECSLALLLSLVRCLRSCSTLRRLRSCSTLRRTLMVSPAAAFVVFGSSCHSTVASSLAAALRFSGIFERRLAGGWRPAPNFPAPNFYTQLLHPTRKLGVPAPPSPRPPQRRLRP